MKKLVLDANAFLRLFLNDIPSQAQDVEKVLRQAKDGKALISVAQITIFEIVFALDKYYHFPKQETVDKLKSILSFPYIKIQDRDIFRRAIELFAAQKVSFVDCFLIALAEQKKAGIFTFDKHLKKLLK